MFSARTFRVVAPGWAHRVLSTEGARLRGGRFNPPGMPAFYSSLDPHTAYAEYTQSLFDRPGLLCSFDIAHAQLLDLTEPRDLAAAELTEESLALDWAGFANLPSQLAAPRLFAQGIDGLIYRSLQHPSGYNLVLWRIMPPVMVTLLDRLGEQPQQPLT